ncbi:hypothetical protein [Chromobacterium sp. ATCC 53434]|uniref:hypothetical protein n=1 Tax=Chromobacterium sp. (strain ATCC 53434 / SC 14030) TaxID=2059672 RepID=UPI0013052D65|nr:hypothetical protein [Chromobacterium sp. ATCC 53434]
MTIDEKKTRIRERLFNKTGEGFLESDFYDNDIYTDLHDEGVRLCLRYAPGFDFLFIDSQRRQAAVLHDVEVVLVYRGMVDHLLNLSSMLSAVTPTPGSLENKSLPLPWKGSSTFWLEISPFDWENGSYWWLHNDDHKLIFNYYLKNLFRFIVLHELGHAYHRHGWRRKNTSSNDLGIEHVAPNVHEVLQSEESRSDVNRIAGHAREIVADTFAFCELTKICRVEAIDPTEDIYSLPPIVCGFATSLLVVGPYFWSMGLVREMNEDAQINQYPTHAFRLQAIESDALRFADEINFPYGLEILHGAMKTTVSYIEKISGDQSYLHWRLKMNDHQHSEHYNLVINEKAKWEN